jgi:hypothetical protein
MSTAGGGYQDPATAGRARGPGGMQAWRTRWAAPPRTQYSSETKPFFLTSEFLVFLLFLMGLGITTATDEAIGPDKFWDLATFVTVGYMLSRGIAKAGSRSRARDPREDLDVGRG